MKNKLDQGIIIIQFILFVFLVIFAIFAMYENVFLIICKAIISLLMYIMAYNSYMILKKDKKYSYIYIAVGIVMTISTIMDII